MGLICISSHATNDPAAPVLATTCQPHLQYVDATSVNETAVNGADAIALLGGQQNRCHVIAKGAGVCDGC